MLRIQPFHQHSEASLGGVAQDVSLGASFSPFAVESRVEDW
jgi:hypothetical protein